MPRKKVYAILDAVNAIQPQPSWTQAKREAWLQCHRAAMHFHLDDHDLGPGLTALSQLPDPAIQTERYLEKTVDLGMLAVQMERELGKPVVLEMLEKHGLVASADTRKCTACGVGVASAWFPLDTGQLLCAGCYELDRALEQAD